MLENQLYKVVPAEEHPFYKLVLDEEQPDHPPPVEGLKYDEGKPQFSLIPQEALEEVASVFTFGAKKYAKDNWRLVEDGHDRYMDAALRHINKHLQGELLDNESSRKHLAHAVASLMMAMDWVE